MGGFAALTRGLVGLANTLTQSLQVVVGHKAWVNSADTGAPLYDPVVTPRQCLYEKVQRLKRNNLGEEHVSSGKMSFLVGNIPPHGASGRQEPIDPRDIFVQPDGSEFPILSIEGLIDPGTNLPYLYEVYLA